jgi:uncharacterized cupredoxin-like copper-binding protein
MVTVSTEDLDGQEVKPGDTVSFKVESVKDGQVELSCQTDQQEEVTDEMAKTMPLDKLEKKLPTAER